MAADSIADRLLDAQVRWVVAELGADPVSEQVPDVIDDLLRLADRVTLADAVDAQAISAVRATLVGRVPASTVGATFTAMVADLVYDGPENPVTLGEVVDRDQVETVIDELLTHTGVLEKVLDDLTRSPRVAALAARFVTLIVREVLQTNRAVADKIPGLGGLISFGASTAGRMATAAGADKQIESLVGGTAGKGAVFAMRGLNTVLVETLRDPAAKAALLDIFDLYADQPLGGLDRPDSPVEREDVHRIAGLIQDAVITQAPSEPVAALVDRLITRFFEVYGPEPLGVLLTDLDLTRDDLVTHARALVPGILQAAVDSGEVERMARAQLTPFYASPEVAEILG